MMSQSIFLIRIILFDKHKFIVTVIHGLSLSTGSIVLQLMKKINICTSTSCLCLIVCIYPPGPFTMLIYFNVLAGPIPILFCCLLNPFLPGRYEFAARLTSLEETLVLIVIMSGQMCWKKQCPILSKEDCY